MDLLKHGAITFLGMACYGAPGVGLMDYGVWSGQTWALVVGGLLLLAAVVAIPGYMSHYCHAFESAEIFNPFLALRRTAQGGRAYWHAWGIALIAMALSFVGVLVLGVGFLVSGVWFWQVAGVSFASVFTRHFRLGDVGS